jgi:imidazolonepropionase-like amidohydrolase
VQALQYLSTEVCEHSQRIASEIDADLARLYARFRDTTTAWIREREMAVLTRIHNMKAAPGMASEASFMKVQQFYEEELQEIVHKIIDPTRKLRGLTFKCHAKQVASQEDYLADAEQILLGLDTEVTEEPAEEEEVFNEETEAMLAQAEE